MFLFLITGTGMFIQAFVHISETKVADGVQPQFINAEYLLRSLVCSFQLFTGSIDSNVMDGIKNYPRLKGLISLQSFLSFCCAIAVLLSLAYARVLAYYKLHRKTKINNSHNHLYVFFGMNDPSRLLAESIRKHKEEGDKAVIIFVENQLKREDSQDGWNHIVRMFTHRKQTFIDTDELDARVTFSDTRLCDISSEKLNINSEQSHQIDILKEVNLLKLRNLIEELSNGIDDPQLHIFFLSENEDENIRSLAVLALDTTIQQTSKNNINQHFYCHARINGLNRIVEDIAFKHGLNVHPIDSSHLAVELLKTDDKNHPVHFVDIDEHNPTTVKSSFNSLIIGFDEVGCDALKFLYEFGAFVDSSATPKDEHRSPFHCVVIDKRMDELKGSFVNFRPAVLKQMNKDGKTPLVELKSCDCLSSEFYEDILKPHFCENLNYIVIAIGNDELGMTMAIRLLNHIRRVRPDLHKLRIYVRSYRSDKEAYMQQIVNYYNDSYNKSLKNESHKNDVVIQLFGQSKEIYTYDIIVNDELIKKGRKYLENYARLRNENTTWDKRRKEAQEEGTLDSIRSIQRKELQDLCNALHAKTKVYLLKKAMSENFDWSDFLKRYFDNNDKPLCEGSYDNIEYPLLTKQENSIILNLARLEHLRWNASHEMLGYTKAREDLHRCDERTREHNCLRPWQELDDESSATLNSKWPCDYKKYDFSVVDTSILLNKDNL
jgi:hypothetical protein